MFEQMSPNATRLVPWWSLSCPKVSEWSLTRSTTGGGFTDDEAILQVPRLSGKEITPGEFPILGKYTLRRWASQPFVSSGYSFRSVSGAYSGTYEQHVVLPVGPVQRFDGKTSYEGTGGFVLGGGVEFHVSRIRIAPELRYTRWRRGVC